MYYDNIKKRWIYELHTREERRKIVKLQRKVVSEDSKTKRRRKHEIVSDMDLHPSPEVKQSSNSEDEILKNEQRRKLKRWIYQLPQSLKPIGVAVFLLGKKQSEVSKELNLSKSSVSKKVQKIAKLLKSKITTSAGGEKPNPSRGQISASKKKPQKRKRITATVFDLSSPDRFKNPRKRKLPQERMKA